MFTRLNNEALLSARNLVWLVGVFQTLAAKANEVSRHTAVLLGVNLLLICLDCNMRQSELQEFRVKLLVINLTDSEVNEATCLHYSLSHCHHT